MVDIIPRELQQNIARIATALEVLAIVAVEDGARISIGSEFREALFKMLQHEPPEFE